MQASGIVRVRTRVLRRLGKDTGRRKLPRPPFALNLWDSVAQLLESSEWLAPHALIYIESPVEQALNLPPTWQPHREGRASAVRYALYRRSDKLTVR